MTIKGETRLAHIRTANLQANNQHVRSKPWKAGRLLLHLVEMTLAMMVGMPIISMLEALIPASSVYRSILEYGTNLFDVTMGVAMTIPMITWMIVRGHRLQHGLEMGFAMFTPVAVIISLRLLGADASISWLDDAGHPAMFLAMIAAMLYRRDHYLGSVHSSGHKPNS